VITISYASGKMMKVQYLQPLIGRSTANVKKRIRFKSFIAYFHNKRIRASKMKWLALKSSLKSCLCHLLINDNYLVVRNKFPIWEGED